MAYRIPTTQEIIDRNLANFESNLNQETPLADKAFLRILSIVEGANYTELNRYAANLVRQNFALTATEDDLDRLGENYGLERDAAVNAEVNVTLDIKVFSVGATVYAGTTFTNANNGLTYYAKNTAQDPDDGSTYVELVLVCQTKGEAGNVSSGDTFTIDIVDPNFGQEAIAVASPMAAYGEEEETDTVYRGRLLEVIRSKGGGSDAYDYRLWAEVVSNVANVYPYSMKPFNEGIFYPGDRTIFVEATSTVDPDGIAPNSLLDSVRDAINYNPTTGRSQPALGHTDLTLYVESIYRTQINVEIRNLSIDSSLIAEAKELIQANLDLYFRSLEPFVGGLDSPLIRNDTITNLSISEVVQDTLSQFAGSASGIGFNIGIGAFLVTYQLQPGEKAKIGTVSYVS